LLSDLAASLAAAESIATDGSQQLLHALFVEQQQPVLLVRLLGWLQQQPQQLTQLLHQDETATVCEDLPSIVKLWERLMRCLVLLASLCTCGDLSEGAPFVQQLTQQLAAAGDACGNR
jgi:hypothetical protein